MVHIIWNHECKHTIIKNLHIIDPSKGFLHNKCPMMHPKGKVNPMEKRKRKALFRLQVATVTLLIFWSLEKEANLITLKKRAEKNK